jgi:branched-chain amino acid transport system substrate-binding protein
MYGRKRWLIALLVLVVVATFGFAGPSAEKSTTSLPKEMKIGALMAVTGDGAFYGKVMTQGQQLALDEINASGALPFKLTLVVEDMKSGDATAGLNGARKLISLDQVPWINSSWPNITLTVAPVAWENHVVLMNGGGAALDLLNVKGLHNTRSLSLSPTLIKYLGKQPGMKKISVIYRGNNEGKGEMSTTESLAAQLGMTIVDKEMYDPVAVTTDFRSYISKAMAAKPDALVIFAYETDQGYIIRQAREMGVTVPIGGTQLNPGSVKIAGDTLEGYIWAEDYFAPANDWAKKFAAAYKTKYGEEAEYYSANYYELMYILRDTVAFVLKNSGNPFDGTQLENALMKVRTFPSLFGPTVTLNDDGSCSKPIALSKWQNNARVFLGSE